MDTNQLVGKRVVVALGGNALGDNPQEQLTLLQETAKHLASMIQEGIDVVITHGNGPQVGVIDEAFVAASKDPANQVPFMPLTDCNAQDIMRAVVDVPTHVLVDASDEAFKDYEKPIGAFMTEKDAQAFAKATGCQVKEDSGRGWRRVVPSPAPQDILELGVISTLVDNGCIVVAAGGGGIPVILEDDRYKAVDAIIDKDLVSSILAWKIHADILVILTAVDKVYINFNQPDQKGIDSMTAEEARTYIAQGQFAPGSMLPKVEACVKFVEAHPQGKAIITSLGHAAEGLRGETGTLITL